MLPKATKVMQIYLTFASFILHYDSEFPASPHLKVY